MQTMPRERQFTDSTLLPWRGVVYTCWYECIAAAGLDLSDLKQRPSVNRKICWGEHAIAAGNVSHSFRHDSMSGLAVCSLAPRRHLGLYSPPWMA